MEHLSDAQIDAIMCGWHYTETGKAFQARQLRWDKIACCYKNTIFPFEYIVGRLVEAKPKDYDMVRVLNSLVRNKVVLDVEKVGKVVVFDSKTNTVRFVFENDDYRYALNDIVAIDLNDFRGPSQVSSPTKNFMVGMLAGVTCGTFALVVRALLSSA